ncbi:MAG: hypothetical protein QMD92_00170 [bacterium]|nr:hypothetical protein [bacterium]
MKAENVFKPETVEYFKKIGVATAFVTLVKANEDIIEEMTVQIVEQENVLLISGKTPEAQAILDKNFIPMQLHFPSGKNEYGFYYVNFKNTEEVKKYMEEVAEIVGLPAHLLEWRLSHMKLEDRH